MPKPGSWPMICDLLRMSVVSCVIISVPVSVAVLMIKGYVKIFTLGCNFMLLMFGCRTMVPCVLLLPVVFSFSTMGCVEVDFGWLLRLPVVFLLFPAAPLLLVWMVAGVLAVMLRCP